MAITPAPSAYSIEYTKLVPVNNPTGDPSAQGYKVIHGNISNASLDDSQDTTDTTVDPAKTYYQKESKTAERRRGSSSRSTDDTGQRGGGAANTGEAEANRSKLLEKGLDYIKHHYKPDSFEVTVKAIDIHLLDPTVNTIEIGDVVKVILPGDPEDIEKKGTCLKIQYDLMAPENTEYTIGDAEKAIS